MVIMPVLYNTIQDLTRQKMNSWAADGEILFRDRCSALLFHPIIWPINMAFWSDLVNEHHMKVKEAFTQLLETGSFYSVFYDLLVTFMGAMQFSTLPIHDSEVNPMYLYREFWSNIPQQYRQYSMPHTELNPHVGLHLVPYSDPT
jgi:hypothetical protein